MAVVGSDLAQADNYFVATNGSDANLGTSLAQPFLTISKAASVANAGDMVNIRGGIYRETVTFSRSGTLASRITFQNYSNEVVIARRPYYSDLLQPCPFPKSELLLKE